MSDSNNGSIVVDPATTEETHPSELENGVGSERPADKVDSTQNNAAEEEARKRKEADDELLARLSGDGSPEEPDAQHEQDSEDPLNGDGESEDNGGAKEISEEDQQLDNIEQKLDPKTSGRAFKGLRTDLKSAQTEVAELKESAAIGQSMTDFAKANNLTDDDMNDALDVLAAINGGGNILDAHTWLKQHLEKVETMAQKRHGIDLSGVEVQKVNASKAVNPKIKALENMITNAKDWGEDSDGIDLLEDQLSQLKAEGEKPTETNNQGKPTETQDHQAVNADTALIGTIFGHLDKIGLTTKMDDDQARAVVSTKVVPMATRLARADGHTDDEIERFDVTTQVAYMKLAGTALAESQPAKKRKPQAPISQRNASRTPVSIKEGERETDEQLLDRLGGG